MHSDQQIASYLRSFSQGTKVDTIKLQHKTELYYTSLKQEFSSNPNLVSDDDIFEFAVIEAFKKVIVEQQQHPTLRSSDDQDESKFCGQFQKVGQEPYTPPAPLSHPFDSISQSQNFRHPGQQHVGQAHGHVQVYPSLLRQSQLHNVHYQYAQMSHQSPVPPRGDPLCDQHQLGGGQVLSPQPWRVSHQPPQLTPILGHDQHPVYLQQVAGRELPQFSHAVPALKPVLDHDPPLQMQHVRSQVIFQHASAVTALPRVLGCDQYQVQVQQAGGQVLSHPNHAVAVLPHVIGCDQPAQLQHVGGQVLHQTAHDQHQVQLQQVMGQVVPKPVHAISAFSPVFGCDQHPVQPRQERGQVHPQPAHAVAALSPVLGHDQHHVPLQQVVNQVLPKAALAVAAWPPLLGFSQRRDQPQLLPGHVLNHTGVLDGLQNGDQSKHLTASVFQTPTVISQPDSFKSDQPIQHLVYIAAPHQLVQTQPGQLNSDHRDHQSVVQAVKQHVDQAVSLPVLVSHPPPVLRGHLGVEKPQFLPGQVLHPPPEPGGLQVSDHGPHGGDQNKVANPPPVRWGQHGGDQSQLLPGQELHPPPEPGGFHYQHSPAQVFYTQSVLDDLQDCHQTQYFPGQVFKPSSVLNFLQKYISSDNPPRSIYTSLYPQLSTSTRLLNSQAVFWVLWVFLLIFYLKYKSKHTA